jgi:hypothetical protein
MTSWHHSGVGIKRTALERIKLRIDLTLALMRTITKLERTCARAHILGIECTQACTVRQAPFDSLDLVFSLPIGLGDWPTIFLGFLGFS